MKSKYFSLRPVSSVQTPKYPVKSSLVHTPGRLAVGAAVASGLGLLLGAGCTVPLEENPDVCTTGDAMCRDVDTLVFCDENHVRQVVDCNDYCVANYGVDWTSHGCSAENADNRCQCDYDQIDGMIAQCYPDEIYCQDEEYITYCDMTQGYGDFTGTPATLTCDQYCKTTLGPDYSSYLGCTADNTGNLCNCEYDMIDGDIAECVPSDILCMDGGQVAICNDSYYYDYFNCTDKCVTDQGEGAISLGCDPAVTEDPCQCVIPE
jgi:hypothetical protein